MVDMHLSDEELIDMVEMPGAKVEKAALTHLAQCEDCRQRAISYSRLIEGMRNMTAETAYDEEWMSHQPEAGYVSPSGRAQYQALHFQQAQARFGVDKAKSKGATIQSEETSFLQRVVNWWNEAMAVNAPLKYAGTAAFTALLCGAIALLMYPVDDRRAAVAFYVDDAQWTVSPETQPGMGFFADAAAMHKNFGNVTVTVNAGVLTAAWPAIAGAQGYVFDLLGYSNGQEESVRHLETAVPRVEIPDLKLQPEKRYIWRVSGQIQGQGRFLRQGGFVVGNG